MDNERQVEWREDTTRYFYRSFLKNNRVPLDDIPNARKLIYVLALRHSLAALCSIDIRHDAASHSRVRWTKKKRSAKKSEKTKRKRDKSLMYEIYMGANGSRRCVSSCPTYPGPLSLAARASFYCSTHKSFLSSPSPPSPPHPQPSGISLRSIASHIGLSDNEYVENSTNNVDFSGFSSPTVLFIIRYWKETWNSKKITLLSLRWHFFCNNRYFLLYFFFIHTVKFLYTSFLLAWYLFFWYILFFVIFFFFLTIRCIF